MIDSARVALRAFIYPSLRANRVAVPNVLRFLVGQGIPLFSDLHGLSCDWEFACVLACELHRANAGFLVAAIDGAVLSNTQKLPFASLLDTPVARFSMSVRAANCLQQAKISTIGELVSLRADKIRRLKNLGSKTLQEIQELISNLDLHLGMTEAELYSLQSLYQSSKEQLLSVNLHLLRGIDTIGCGKLSLRFRGISVVGELLQGGEAFLANTLSPEEVAIVRNQLKELGIELSDQLAPWQKEWLSELATLFRSDLLSSEEAAPECLDVELCRRVVREGRNGEIAIRYFGLDGRPTETLEEIGRPLGLTRERVRQILEKIRERMGSKAPGSLRLALCFVNKHSPCDAEELERKLLSSGLTSRPFRLESLRKIAEMFELPVSFSIIEEGGVRIAVDSQSIGLVSKILNEARKRISQYGITSVTYVADGLADAKSGHSRSYIEKFLPLLRGLTWLDQSREWFWSAEVPRNPIMSRIRKVFSVAKTVTVEELRSAVLRDSRTSDINLPSPVLERLCSSCSGYLKVEGGTVMCAADQSGADLSEAETAIYVALRDQPGPVRRIDLKRICSTFSDGSEASLERTIGSSAIIKPIGSGYYTLVGRDAAVPSESVNTPDAAQAAIASAIGANWGPEGKPTLFFDLSASSEFFVWSAAMRLLARAKSLGLLVDDSRWSMVELNWSADDLSVLHRWAKSASIEGQKSRTFQSRALTQREALAIVFLAYCFDVARRRATEGELWPQIYREIGEHLRSELFNGDRAVPKYWLQEATEDACRRFNLRHAFGREGAMAWLRTVYLQFGLTTSGLRRLPKWLSGAKLPVAINDLLDDPDLQAPEFRNVWAEVRQYRSGLQSTAELRKVLEGSTWFSWHDVDQLIAAASEKTESQPSQGLLGQEDEESDLFVIRLLWDSADPSVCIEASPNWPEEFSAPEYVVQFGEEYRARLIRSEQGRFILGEFRIPLLETQLSITLIEKGHCIASGYSLSIFNGEDELVFFDRSTGKRQDLWNVKPGRPVVLACRGDIQVFPKGIRMRRVAQNSWVLHDFPNGCPQNLKVELEGQLLWQPLEPAGSRRQSPSSIQIRLSGGRLGEYSTADVSMPPELTAIALIIGDQIVRRSASGFKVALAPLNYDRIKAGILATEGTGVHKLAARIVLLNDVWGAALRKKNSGWLVLNSNDMLDRQDFIGKKLFIRPPRSWHGIQVETEEWALLEGQRFCARSRRQGVAGLDSVLAGVGEPLRLTIGPYNSSGQGIDLALAISDSGLIANIDATEGGYCLTLSSALDFGPEHGVWIWQRGEHAPRNVDRRQISCVGRDLIVHTTQQALAFAVSFRGSCLGSRFVHSECIDELREVLTPESWEAVRPWMRWWRIPLLHPRLKDLAAKCIDKSQLPTLLSWVADSGFGDMSYTDESIGSSGWGAVIREFFWHWMPNELQASEILRATRLLTGSPESDLKDSWMGSSELALINPVLLAAIVVGGVKSMYSNVSDAERQLLLSMFANIIAGLPRESGTLDAVRTELFQRGVKELGADPAFVRRVLWNEAVDLYHGRNIRSTNLRVAIGVQPFRRWLVLELLEVLGKVK
ncbi:MAG TPA: DNA-directed RNA polymerase subunit alpha C-terminal domain-containing protein [Candidatus Angelobacter sp.]|nr:DNA-directed RNA polymerase subunit alpha C-terminal domain-containing protein [Candidatus Angelobacter sp.]